MDRIDLYLRAQEAKGYENTEKEKKMVDKVSTLFAMAESYQNGVEYVSTQNLEMWRKAYLGALNALSSKTGKESSRKSKQLRKMIYELIESKVDNSLPMARLRGRRKTDLVLVEITGN